MMRYLPPLAVFLGAGAFYYFQACPTFYYWDSAELTAAILGGGVPHPPGFPLFLLLAGGWGYIAPLGRVFSLNMLSVFFAALGLAVWFLVTRLVLKYIHVIQSEIVVSLLSLATAVLIGVSLTYGIQATRLEVYALNFAGFGGLMLLALGISQRWGKRGLEVLWLFALLGLMLGVHILTIALAIPGILTLLIARKKLDWKLTIMGMTLSLLLAAGLYSTLIFRAETHPLLNWGDPSNLQRFIDYVFVREFSVSTSRLSVQHFGELIAFAFGLLAKQLGVAGLVMSFLGLAFITARERAIGISLIVILVLNILSVALAENYFYENYDLHGYLTISLGILALSFAAGALLLYELVAKRIWEGHTKVGAAVLAFAVTVGLMVFPIGGNLGQANLSSVRGAEDYAGRFLAGAPRDAIVLTSSYNTYFCALAYRKAYRNSNDQIILNIYNWDHPWGREQGKRLLGIPLPNSRWRQEFYKNLVTHVLRRRPLYIEYDESSGALAEHLWPQGLGYVLETEIASDSVAGDESIIARAMKANDIESIRTWGLWLHNRGEYYRRRGATAEASKYDSAFENLASKY
jgi:hypothetical protein